MTTATGLTGFPHRKRVARPFGPRPTGRRALTRPYNAVLLTAPFFSNIDEFIGRREQLKYYRHTCEVMARRTAAAAAVAR